MSEKELETISDEALKEMNKELREFLLKEDEKLLDKYMDNSFDKLKK
jgi:hypothetical protein